MTQTPQTPDDRLDRLEATLTRFAELSFQSHRQHDDAISRNEAAIAQLLEATSRNTEAAARHDGAIAQLLEATNRNTEAVSRLEANSVRHDENFFRFEGAIIDLANRMDRNERGIEALRTTAAETLQLVAEQARLHAQHRAEIEEIWRYLRYQPRNGNGRGE